MSQPVVADRTPHDRILIRGLQVNTYIGVYDVERLDRQPVVFDVEATTVPGYADIVAVEGRYASYGTIVDFIEERANRGDHIDLVETWAEEVAAFVLQNELIDKVVVRVSKTEIIGAAAGVGVEIVRYRPGAE